MGWRKAWILAAIALSTLSHAQYDPHGCHESLTLVADPAAVSPDPVHDVPTQEGSSAARKTPQVTVRPAPAAETIEPTKRVRAAIIRKLDGDWQWGMLAHSGEAVVYLGKSLENEDDVVLKVPVDETLRDPKLRAVAAERFRQSAEVVEAVRNSGHPGARWIPWVKFEETPDGPALLMPFVPGKTLAQLSGRLPAPQIHKNILQALSAVEATHSQGYVHRDVKPSNLVLDEDGDVHLIDFTIMARPGTIYSTEPMAPREDEKTHISDGPDTTITSTEIPLGGTPKFLPPDQMQEKGIVGRHTDAFALALTLEALLLPRDLVESGWEYKVASPFDVSGEVGNKISRLKYSAYTLEKSRREPAGSPMEASQENRFAMLSSIAHIRDSYSEPAELRNLLESAEDAVVQNQMDKWYREKFFPHLLRANASHKLSAAQVTQLIFSDSPAAARLLQGKSGLTQPYVQLLMAKAAQMTESPRGVTTIPVGGVSPYSLPAATREARIRVAAVPPTPPPAPVAAQRTSPSWTSWFGSFFQPAVPSGF